jgi:hypothetical protein
MYWEFKEMKESISDKYKKSFNSISSGESNDQLSLSSVNNEDKSKIRDELMLSTVKHDRRKFMDSMSPDTTLSLNKRTISKKTKDEINMKVFKNNKTIEFSESINRPNYDSSRQQFTVSVTASFKSSRKFT